MKAVLGSRSRFIKGLAISAGLTLVAIQPLGVHAGGTPTISASVNTSKSIVHISGAGFGIGDKVKVVERTDFWAQTDWAVVGTVFTTATRRAIAQPPVNCGSKAPCLTIITLDGVITVDLPPQVVHCSNENVTVRAYDMTTHIDSNVVHTQLGLGPC